MQNYFTLFGLEPSIYIDQDALEQRYKRLQQLHHPDQHIGKDALERMQAAQLSATINQAYHLLRDDLTRAGYFLQLHGEDVAKTKPSQSILLEAMEMQEANANDVLDEQAVLQAREEARGALDMAITEHAWQTASQAVLRLTYLAKLKGEHHAD